MNGLLNRSAYPEDSMSNPIAVSVVGSTLALIAPDDLIQTEENGTMRPSKAGDVLSLQPNGGGWQGRPAGTNGAYEQMAVNGALAVYSPVSDRAQARGFLFWPSVPNI